MAMKTAYLSSLRQNGNEGMRGFASSCCTKMEMPSDWQGYGKPSGLGSKGSKGRGQGRGQGRHLATLEKPLPLTRVSRV